VSVVLTLGNLDYLYLFMGSLSTSQPMSKTKEGKVTLNLDFIGKPFSTVNGYDYLH